MLLRVNGQRVDVAVDADSTLLWVLREQLMLTGSAVQQTNFHDYPLLRMADTPDIRVRVISTDNPPGGIGEVGLPPVAPAIANAVAALTGVRVRQLPMLPERVLTAMKS